MYGCAYNRSNVFLRFFNIISPLFIIAISVNILGYFIHFIVWFSSRTTYVSKRFTFAHSSISQHGETSIFTEKFLACFHKWFLFNDIGVKIGKRMVFKKSCRRHKSFTIHRKCSSKAVDLRQTKDFIQNKCATTTSAGSC